MAFHLITTAMISSDEHIMVVKPDEDIYEVKGPYVTNTSLCSRL